MECGKQNIKIVEGNEFALVLPLKQRTFVASTPIDEDIVYADLQDVVLKIGDTQFTATLETYGVQVLVPHNALTRGTYDILLTATYHGSEIRASYFEALTIVQYNSQSDAQQYIAGSPIVLDAAYVIGGTLTDAELEALKEEYREKNAQLDQAIADAEAAKAEWEQKAADLDGVAKESTSQDILTAVENIDIDLTPITDSIGTPSQGQSPTLFGAIGDVALSAQTLQSLADSWSAIATNKTSLAGWVLVNGQVVNGVGDLMTKYLTSLLSVYDESVVKFNRYSFFANCTTVERIELPNLDYVNAYSFMGCTNLKEIVIPNVNQIGISVSDYQQQFTGCARLEKIELPLCVYVSSYLLFSNCAFLKRVSFSHNMQYAITPSGGNWFTNCVNLIDLEFGYLTDNVLFTNSWNPTNALDANSQTLLTQDDLDAGFTNNLEKLLYNIREHIAANLPVAPNTITFSAAVKAAILADAATMTAFTNKGWTIA